MQGTETLERLAVALDAERDVQVAVAFGSMARGEARFDSDIDVAVLTDRPLTSERRSSLMKLVASVTGRAVDLVDLRAAGVPLLRGVLRKGRELVRKDEAAYGRLVARMLADAEDLPPQHRLPTERRDRWIHGSSARSSSRCGAAWPGSKLGTRRPPPTWRPASTFRTSWR